jgi:hypothetical protein
LSVPLAASSTDVLSFVQKSCVGYHKSVKSGDIDLAALRDGKTFDHDREIWEKWSKLKPDRCRPAFRSRPLRQWPRSRNGSKEFARQDWQRPDAGRDRGG